MKQLRKSEIKDLIVNLKSKYDIDLGISPKDNVIEDEGLILVKKKPMLFYYEEDLIPTLHVLQENQFLKSITIDMGAIGFVIKGADVMRPGITKIDSAISKGEPVAIIDETHSKPIAVGVSLYSSEDMDQMDSGKVIKTIHYVGDTIWNKN